MTDYLITFLLAMTPIGELRVSIPFGLNQGLAVPITYVISILGNMIPPMAIIYGMPRLAGTLRSRYKFLDILFEKIIIRVRKKTEKQILKYGAFGLMIFVAIPLPNTGAWTGSMAAWLFGIPKKTALTYTFFGVCIAGVIMTLLTLGVLQVLQ